MRRIASLVLLALVALDARAQDVPDPEPLLESLVRQTVSGPELEDPSPTRLTADLLRTDPALLRTTLRRHWDSRHLLTWDAARGLEEVTCLLFGDTPEGRDLGERPPACGLWEVAGAVLVRKVHTGERWDGPFAGRDLPEFERAFARREFRPPPAPSASGLWAALESGAPESWGAAERISFALALGEAPAVRKKLIARAAASPRSGLLAVALGGLGGPDATALLTARFLAAIPHRRSYRETLRNVARCLARADPDAPRRAVDSLEPDRRDRAIEQIGGEFLLPSLLRDLGAAKDAAGRKAAIAALGETAGKCFFGYRSHRDLPEHLRSLLRALDAATGEDRAAVLRVAKWVFGIVESFPLSGSFSSSEGSYREQGRWVGPIGGVEHLLRSVVEDLDAGRLLILDPPPPRWGLARFLTPPVRPVKADGSRAQTNRPSPMPNQSKPDREFPVHASGKPVEGGVELILKNVGNDPFLVSPVALRYGTMAVTQLTTRRAGEGKETHFQLKLELGRAFGPFAVPAGQLRRLDPGKTFTWLVPVPPEFGRADGIVIEFDRLPVVGRTDLPVLLHLSESWVR